MTLWLINKNSAKIILFFAISPGSNYTRKEIQDKTKINNVPLDISLIELSILKILNINRKFYSLNLDNPSLKLILREIKGKVSNLPLNVQYIVLEAVSTVLKIKEIREIILFGSYSKLIYSEKSDVDLAVIFGGDIKQEDNARKKILNNFDKISKKHGNEIQAHFFLESDLKHKEDPLIRDILKNGRRLLQQIE